MKRFSLKALCALLVVAACTDGDPVALAFDAAPQSALWQAGNGAAWHGYTAPSVAYDDGTGWLCATWMDHELFSRDGGQYADTDFFSFEFEVQEEGVWVEAGDARNVAGSLTGCLDLSAWEEGSYPFRVTAMARHGTGQTTTTHHTDAWEGTVVVGAALRFQVEIRKANTLYPSSYGLGKNPDGWDVQFIVKVYDPGTDAFVKVTDCSALPYASITSGMVWSAPSAAESTGAPVAAEECVPTGGAISAVVYKVHFVNEAKGSASAGDFEFTIDGTMQENGLTFSTS